MPHLSLVLLIVTSLLAENSRGESVVGYIWACTAICPDGSVVAAPSCYSSESECNTASASAITSQCSNWQSNSYTFVPYAFDDNRGTGFAACTSFVTNLLQKSSNKRAVVTNEQEVKSTSCSCREFVSAMIREGISLDPKLDFCDGVIAFLNEKVDQFLCRKTKLLGKLVRGFCEQVIGTVTGLLQPGAKAVCRSMQHVISKILNIDLDAIYKLAANELEKWIDKISSATCGPILCDGVNGACEKESLGTAGKAITVVSDSAIGRLICSKDENGKVTGCFHEATLITYHDNTFGMNEVWSQPNCVISHFFRSNGVKISTTCNGHLELTEDHLVFTQRGLIQASTVKIGDVLYKGLNDLKNNTCSVTSIKAQHQHNYFGLGCEDSVVLANGYKVSTFSEFHTIPSLWMKYGSKILGVNKTTSLGVNILSWIKPVLGLMQKNLLGYNSSSLLIKH